ncbi:MAG TPA: YceD family protein [Rhizomicrobium sp.]
MKQALPIEHIFDLGRLSQAEQTVTLAPDAEQRARIAAWAGVEEIKSFAAEVNLRKQSASLFLADFKLRTEVEQNCVATLEPMSTMIARDFSRTLHFAAAPYHSGIQTPVALLDMTEEEGPEEIESLRYDLAAPILEELVLAIDPYPRKATFQAPSDPAPDDGPQSPFAALKSLKSRS